MQSALILLTLFFIVNSVYCKIDVLDLIDITKFDNIVAESKYVIALFCEDPSHDTCTEGKRVMLFVAARINVNERDLALITVDDVEKASSYELKSLPKLLFFRSDEPILYTDPIKAGDEIIDWFMHNMEVSGRTLNDDNFEHDTQAASGATTGDWLVMFYDSEKCPQSLPLWEAVASKLKQRMNVARVDTKTNTKLVERFQLKECISIKLFHHGTMYDYLFKNNRELNTVTTFAETWYKNVKGVPVPVEPSPFDKVTDDAAKLLKAYIEGNGVAMVVGICVVFAILCVTFILACLRIAIKPSKVKAT